MVKLKDYRPAQLEALRHIEQSAVPLLEAGMSAEDVAATMLYAAHGLFAHAQGASRQVDGWQQRTYERFQRAVSGFCVENCNATITGAGDVLLPYLSPRDGGADE
jgi:hypothetical protein